MFTKEHILRLKHYLKNICLQSLLLWAG